MLERLTSKTPVNLKDRLIGQDQLWNQFTRNVEYGSINRDKHGRHIPDQADLRDIATPTVSRHLLKKDFSPEYPDGKKFAICLTHDVDDIYPPIIHSLISVPYHLKERDFSGLKRTLLWRIGKKEESPYSNLRDIVSLEESYGARSTFFFISAERDIRRFRYRIEDLEEDLAFLSDKGWGIGLHGGYYAYDCLEELSCEKRRLEEAVGRAVVGYRGHYLRFRVPLTWELLSAAGFSYDSTFGYGGHPGFRNQMCHPFYPYNLEKDRPIDIMEIPLNLADMALFGMRAEQAWQVVKALVDVVEENRGVLTVLWHNHIFGSPFRRTTLKIYHKLLDYARHKDAWMASSDDIWRLFRNGL